MLEAARALGRSEGATLYMTLLAAFQVLLYRYSGQEDIAVGSPSAGRARPELEGVIGFFVNTLVLRGDLSGRPTFRELLRRVRRTAIDAFTHQNVPFEKLVTMVDPDRDGDRSPLFQVMFALQNMPLPPLRASELLISPIELATETAKFDLTLFAAELPDGLRLTMEYSTDLFDAATIDRMLGHYRTLLAAIIADPGQTIGALPMLTELERNQVVLGWSGAESDDFATEFDEDEADDPSGVQRPFAPTEIVTHE
jgi:non-ribosomal peptide synthetase component F